MKLTQHLPVYMHCRNICVSCKTCCLVYLKDFWRCVSIRSIAETEEGVDETEDVVRQVPLQEANSLMMKPDLSDVDIYNMYSYAEETFGQ